MTEEKKCPLYKKCGGCQLQNLSYAEQLKFKQRKVEKLLGEFAHVEPIIGMAEPYHYRNKVQAAFATARNGKIISGVYQSGTHSIVCVDSCLTEDRKADEIIVSIRNMLKSFRIQPYDERSGCGTLRHVLVKRGFKTISDLGAHRNHRCHPRHKHSKSGRPLRALHSLLAQRRNQWLDLP